MNLFLVAMSEERSLNTPVVESVKRKSEQGKKEVAR